MGDNWRRLENSYMGTMNGIAHRIPGSQQRRDFHSSSRQQGWPLLWQVAALLKSSGALSAVQVVGRIALTLLPMAVLKRSIFRKLIRVLPVSEHPTLANLHKHMESSINFINVTMWGLLIVPGALFAATILASMERTPVTGRWRLILLSPEEERGVSADLAGDGWRDAVAQILTEGDTEPLPRVIPPSDWRTQWVLQTWRLLESVVPLLQADDEEVRRTFDQRARDIASEEHMRAAPYPPPSQYALLPRPRATTLIHAIAPCVSDMSETEASVMISPPYAAKGQRTAGITDSHPARHLGPQDPPAHTQLGPPYSVLLVEKPNSANAFSYGFGPDGAGGVVVYSGFLDEILKKTQGGPVSLEPSVSQPPTSGGLGLLSFFTGSPTPPKPITTQSPYISPAEYTPTPEQTNQLAILLAHEMAHLVLSHHLETLSSNSILVPTVVGMLADLTRTLAFPFTMIFGPFVNDALFEVSKLGTGEVVKSSEACRVKGLEIEADLVGARLLAYAGFDARAAAQFWEEREAKDTCADTQKKATPAVSGTSETNALAQIAEWLPFKWPHREGETAGTWFTHGNSEASGHPISAERGARLRAELKRWEKEREKHVKSLMDNEAARPAAA